MFNPATDKNFKDLDDRYKLDTVSGFADFTQNGDLLELTEDQKSRAITRKVKLT
jgi:hypothetical protein